MSDTMIPTTTFSGKLAIIATLLFVFAISNQVAAAQLTTDDYEVIEQQSEMLLEQSTDSEDQLFLEQQDEFDLQLEQAEDEFMTDTCDDYGRDYDQESEVCIE